MILTEMFCFAFEIQYYGLINKPNTRNTKQTIISLQDRRDPILELTLLKVLPPPENIR